MYRLAEKRKITPDDLVWCDGMEKWVPARTIRGMFPEDDDAGLLTDMFDQAEIPKEESDPVLETPPDLDQVNYFNQPATPAIQLGEIYSLKWFLTHSRSILVGSFLLILFSKGCELAGERQVQRQQSLYELSMASFEDRYSKKLAPLGSRIVELQNKAPLTVDEAERLQRFRIARNDIENQKAAEMANLENGEWSDMRVAATSNRTDFAFWSYYRQLFILFCTVFLSAALFARFFTGARIEKWLAVVLLAIVASSIFISDLIQVGSG